MDVRDEEADAPTTLEDALSSMTLSTEGKTQCFKFVLCVLLTAFSRSFGMVMSQRGLCVRKPGAIEPVEVVPAQSRTAIASLDLL